MLMEFSVANYKSIKEEACLSMVAGTGKEHWETHLFSTKLSAKERPATLVRSAAIFGANAAGKSNLIDALATMKYIVNKSNQGLEKIPTTPFKFDPKFESQGTTFEVQCIVDGVKYQYGFKVTYDEVIEEWLFAWPLEEFNIGLNATVSTGISGTNWWETRRFGDAQPVRMHCFFQQQFR